MLLPAAVLRRAVLSWQAALPQVMAVAPARVIKTKEEKKAEKEKAKAAAAAATAAAEKQKASKPAA